MRPEPEPRTWKDLARLLGISPDRFDAEAETEQILRELERLSKLPTYTLCESEGERVIVQFDDQENAIGIYHQFDDAPDLSQMVILRGETINRLLALVVDYVEGRV